MPRQAQQFDNVWLALKKILTVVLGILVPLFLIEVAMRVFAIKPERYHMPKRLVEINGHFVDVGWGGSNPYIKEFSPEQPMGKMIPNTIYKYQYASDPNHYFSKGYTVPVNINNLGLRGKDTTLVKPMDVTRILAIGDSFTLGAGVYDGDAFPAQFEQRLQLNGDQKFEVLNAGVEGYNTRDAVYALETQWLVLKPDIVVLTFYLNDAYGDQAIPNKGQDLGIYLAPSGVGRLSYVYDFFAHRLAVKKIASLREEYFSKPYFKNPARGIAPDDANFDWNSGRKALVRLKELSKQHQFRILFVLYPELTGLKKAPYPFVNLHNFVSGYVKSLGIDTLDLLPYFVGKEDSDLWVHPSDHHPNKKAHSIAANAIVRHLKLLTVP